MPKQMINTAAACISTASPNEGDTERITGAGGDRGCFGYCLVASHDYSLPGLQPSTAVVLYQLSILLIHTTRHTSAAAIFVLPPLSASRARGVSACVPAMHAGCRMQRPYPSDLKTESRIILINIIFDVRSLY